jgi:tetratricopeptide (TPR) repeat protein
VLVTSRGSLTGLVAREGAKLLTLDVLSQGESLELLARVAGHERVDSEPQAAAEAVRRCGYLPLAVRIAAAKLAARPRMRIAELVSRLADEQSNLAELTAGDVEVRASFALSYQELSPLSARTFRRLGLIAGPDFTAGAVAALVDTTTEQAAVQLEALLDAHLVEDAPVAGRYRLHDLLRLYARERVQAEEGDADRADALRRMLLWYLAIADAAGRLLNPARHRLPCEGLGEPPESVFPAQSEPLAWFNAELPNLVAATQQAADGSFHPIAWQLPDALWSFFHLRRHLVDRCHIHRIGLVAARHAHDRQAEAWMLTSLGGAHRPLGRFDEAIEYLEKALPICREVGDRWGEARALHYLTLSRLRFGRFDEARLRTQSSPGIDSFQRAHREPSLPLRILNAAVGPLEQALMISREVGDRYREGHILSNLGEVYWQLGRHREGIECLERSLAICRAIGDSRGHSFALYNLAEVNRNQGHLEEAADQYRESAFIRREIGDLWGEARVLQFLGLTLQHSQDGDAARACWQEALTIFSRLGEPEAEEVRGYLLALRGSKLKEAERAS